jgi:uncharacterized protein (DUF2147 family)
MRATTLQKFVAVLGLGIALAVPMAGASEGEALGTWLTADGESHIRIQPCGAELCGTVVWLREPHDSAGRPFRDKRNPNPALRDRELLGMRIFFDLVEVDPGQQWRGRVYNPKDGSTYLAYITVVSSERLDVKGCVLGGIICSTQAWSRVDGTGNPSASGTTAGASVR